MRPTPPDRLHHGVAWYPELWPAEQIDRDLAAMRRLGLTVVRIAEFAWSTMEPAEGAIDCSFFRHVMDRAHTAADPWGRFAGHEQGAASILIGIAGVESIRRNQPVDIATLVPLNPAVRRLGELV
jgi:hypothetical protein